MNISNTNIFSIIRKEVSDYVSNDIEIVSGFTLNTYATIKRCHLYYNSKFESSTKINGKDKLFYNINKYRAKIAGRMLNIDTKDIRLFPLNPSSRLATVIFEKELKVWMKLNKVGEFLNKIATLAPIYGSVVLKKTKKGAQIIDLRRLALDPTVDNIIDSRFIIIRHYLTDSELRKRGKENGWDADVIEEVILKDKEKERNAPSAYPMREESSTNIIRSSVYHEIDERYGEVPESWLKDGGDEDKMVRSVFIVANSNWITTKGEYQIENGLTLFKSEWNKEYPFKDYHYDKTEGRWLGVGVLEDLFPAQERRNEIVNQKRISMELSSLHIFQTSDQTIIQNILTDLQSGDVVRSGQGGFQPLVNEERNLAAFANEEASYDTLADRLSFTYDVTRGEAMASSMPATNAVIQNTNSQSEFMFRREMLALVIQDYFNELVLPQVLKDLSAEHIFRFAGSIDDLNFFDSEYAKLLANEKIIKNEVEVNSEEDRRLLVQQIIGELRKQGKERFINIKENLYKEIEFEFDINIVNEQENIATMAQNTFTILTAIAQNPQIIHDPVVKPLFYKYAEMIGVNPLDLDYKEQQNQQQQMPQQQGVPQGMPQQMAQRQIA